MRKPADFATADFPLRCSSLPYFLRCPGRVLMDFLIDAERTSGKAADTGSAAHLGVSLWHKGATADEAVKQMRAAAPATFPLADLDEAEKYFRLYTRDPRNTQTEVVHTELPVTCTLPPHPDDPTKQPIHLSGTVDQVREVAGGYEVWDLKTGKDDGVTMLFEFAAQLAGYCMGVRTIFPPERVRVGGIIRARGYTTRGEGKPELSPSGVFFQGVMGDDIIDTLLFRIRHTVACIRRGDLLLGPGALCGYCPHGGIGACVGVARGLSLGIV